MRWTKQDLVVTFGINVIHGHFTFYVLLSMSSSGELGDGMKNVRWLQLFIQTFFLTSLFHFKNI